jgi:hypothetical protein
MNIWSNSEATGHGKNCHPSAAEADAPLVEAQAAISIADRIGQLGISDNFVAGLRTFR